MQISPTDNPQPHDERPSFSADLHCHSTFSDGALAPDDLVARAKEAGVTLLALTDHDTLDGWSSFRDAAQQAQIEPVTGVELTCAWQGREIHVVGLDFDVDDLALSDLVAAQQTRRIARAQAIGEKLAKKRITSAYEMACALSQSAYPGRVHFAQVLVDRGIVRAKQQAFDKYLGAGKPCFVKTQWPELAQVVLAIKKAGGVSVLAHPCGYKMTRTKMRALIEDFVTVGGQALEVVSGNQEQTEAQMLLGLAQQYGLYESVGSDFHYPTPWLNLGGSVLPKDSQKPVWQAFRRARVSVQ